MTPISSALVVSVTTFGVVSSAAITVTAPVPPVIVNAAGTTVAGSSGALNRTRTDVGSVADALGR